MSGTTVAVVGSAGVGELVGESGVAVDFDQLREQLDSRRSGGGRCGERFDVARELLGGQRRHDQPTVMSETGEAFAAMLSPTGALELVRCAQQPGRTAP